MAWPASATICFRYVDATGRLLFSLFSVGQFTQSSTSLTLPDWGSANVGLHPEKVFDAESDRGMDLHVLDFRRGEERGVEHLLAGHWFSADETACETDGELLADLAVGVLDDVARVRVHADERHHLHVEPGFFLHLACGRLCDELAGLHGTTQDRPQAVVTPAGEENPTMAVGRQSGSCRDQPGRHRELPGRGRP